MNKKIMNEEIRIKLRKLGAEIALDQFGLNIDPERFEFKEYPAEFAAGTTILRGILAVATQEEPFADFPSTWWEHFKERWFPHWLVKMFPIKYTEVIARHTYPELHIPEAVLSLGREFVTVEFRADVYRDE